MRRWHHPALLILCAVALGACDDAAPAVSDTPTAASTGVAAEVYLLRGSTVAAYQVSEDIGLEPQTLADKLSLPSLPAELKNDRYLSGAEITYVPKKLPTLPPFANIITRALLFNDVQGAAAFFTAESARNRTGAVDGTQTPLSNPPHDNTDQLLALQQTNPADSSGVSARGFLALARRGRVVIQLFASVTGTATTAADFTKLMAAQEAQLATSPD